MALSCLDKTQIGDVDSMNLLERIRKSNRVFIVAVAGDSGSGKTTFSSAIRRMLGVTMVSTFSLDDYHCLDRAARKEQGITPLHPDANQFELLAEHLSALRRGETVDKPVYDHQSGEIRGTEPFSASPVIIIEGLHPFYTPQLRELTDFKVFVDPSRGVKRRWKLRRDVGERGYDPEEVMKEILQREPDYKLYVDVQKIYAEMVIKIQESRFPPPWHGAAPERYSVRLIQQMLDVPMDEVELTIDLSKLMRLSEQEFSIEFQRDDYYGKRVGVMTIDGELHRAMIEELEMKLCQILGTSAPAGELSDPYVNATKMAQMMLMWRFLEKVNYLTRD